LRHAVAEDNVFQYSSVKWDLMWFRDSWSSFARPEDYFAKE